MSHIFLESREGRLRLYLHGELQFDSRDERRYHEPLALVPTALAVARRPGRALRALILGGGDGLALREVLRFAEVEEVHLVDRDPEVLRLGREVFATLNRGAFRDARVRVHVLDARNYLGEARGFDVLIYDLTYPADVGGAALFSAPFFRKARAALRPGGVVAVNAVSPELTPEAFGCVGATLGAAGLWAVPYAFALPSFREEEYGRWGFFFASTRAIGKDELRRLRLPAGAELTAETLLAGTLLPAAAADVMRAAPNRTDELLFYLNNATTLRWTEPWRSLRFTPSAAGLGPRLTVAQGFARWLRAPAGHRTLEELLRCLPLSHRSQTRDVLLEWSEQAEILFREVDLRAFVASALRRTDELPRAWVRELRALRDRLREGLPPLRQLLEQAYRVFAIFLLVLLLANLFFPDNLFAKGFSSSSSSRTTSWSSGSASSSEAPFFGFHFSDPGAPFAPYRRFGAGGGRPWAAGAPRPRVYDSRGQDYPAQPVALAAPQGGPQPLSTLLALTPLLQLVESGSLVYVCGIPGFQCLLDPGRLRVQDTAGRDVLALLPPADLTREAQSQVLAQGPLIDKALADHQRWTEWVRWASVLPQGRQATAELAELTAIQKTVATAQSTWRSPAPPPAFSPGPGWLSVFPGVYLDPAGASAVGLVEGRWVPIVVGTPRYATPPESVHRTPMVVLVDPEGAPRTRLMTPPAEVTNEDRFLFRLLARRLAEYRDESLRDMVERWRQAQGEALDALPAPPIPPGSRS